MQIKNYKELIKLPIVIAFIFSIIIDAYLETFWGDRYTKSQSFLFGVILFLLDSCVAAEILKNAGLGHLQYSRAILINFFSSLQIAIILILVLTVIYIIYFFLALDLSSSSSLANIPREDNPILIYYSIIIRSFVCYGAEVGIYCKNSSMLLKNLFVLVAKVKTRFLSILGTVFIILIFGNFISRYYPYYTGVVDGLIVLVLSFIIRPWLYSILEQVDKKDIRV